MRAAIYARYSTERQSETSLADQFRLGRERAATLGLTVIAEHGDDAVSGSTPVAARPGGKALLADALAGRFDVLLIEGIDRLSREIGEAERIVKRLEHRGLRIVGLADGYDSQAPGRKVMRIARGLVNELYLDDLRAKTHRGLTGQVLRGLHAGGLSYGYRSVPVDGGHALEVDAAQADVVRRIFDAYAGGASCQAIAHALNRERVPAPRGGTWAVSGLYGSPRKGSGLLNNELYLGRYVWNRSQWLKDPDTGRRVRIDRPRHEWRIDERPALRIVSDEQWTAVRARMQAPAWRATKPGGQPRTLFGGLLRCAGCGGAVVAVDRYTYGCAAHKDRGTCAGVRVARRAADARLVAAVRDELQDAEAIAHVRGQVRALLAGAERDAARLARERETRGRELEREIAHLVDAVASVGVSPAIAGRLRAAEAELAGLRDLGGAVVTRESDRFADREIDAAYRRLLMRLQNALQGDVTRARSLLADVLGPVRIERLGEEIWAEASIDAARLLVAAGGGSKMAVVAGGRFCNRKRWRLA